MSISEHYTVTGGGLGVTVNNTTAAYTSQYQCVTSHGNWAVSDAFVETKVQHTSGMTILGPINFNHYNSNSKKGLVHVPIQNPPGMIVNLQLQNIIVKFKTSDGDANVNSVSLYYDSTNVLTADTKKSEEFHIDFNTTEAKKYAYVIPQAISVALDLRFPNPDSSIQLYSVTLVYKTA